MTEDSLLPFDLPAVRRKKVTADFDGGLISSDGGLVLLREAERRLGPAEALAGCIRLTVRGDSHYGRPEAMAWCEDNGVDYIFGLAGNAILHALSDETGKNVRARRAEAGTDRVRGFADFDYAAGSAQRAHEDAHQVRVGAVAPVPDPALAQSTTTVWDATLTRKAHRSSPRAGRKHPAATSMTRTNRPNPSKPPQMARFSAACQAPLVALMDDCSRVPCSDGRKTPF